ncbi:MAG: ATP-binding protein [Planctomycetota bacterium]
MLRSRLFWKLLLTFTALNALGLAALGYVALRRLERQAIDDATGQVRREARFLADAVAAGPLDRAGQDEAELARLQALVVRMAATSGDRLTLISGEGNVLADSAAKGSLDQPPSQPVGPMPEVAAARAQGFGADLRIDPATGEQALFVAKRVAGAGPVDLVHATRDLSGLALTQAGHRRAYLWRGGLVGALFAVAASALVRHVVRPVLSLNQAADAIARGDYQQRAFVPGNDELGVLARSFNRMSQELGSQLVELREGGQRQATVLGGMIEGVIAVDDRECVLFANTAAGKLFSFIPPQVEGRPLLEVVRHHTLHQAVASGLSTGRPQRLEAEWEDPERRILLVQVTPLPGDPCPGVVVVLHDTTELRRLESLRQDFVANVSHELKTPLSSIKAYTETLLDGAVNDQDHNLHFLGRIEEQADRLNNLIQDLLALARIESAQQPFEISPVAVAEVVGACVDDYRKQAESKQISLRQESLTGGLRVKADPEGLRVIVNNLIDNAIKYTPVGGAVAVRWASIDTSVAKIDVADTGIGIPGDALPRVFERFYRVDKARSQEMGGTGLGLAIVKHLAQAFGGTVAVASEEGAGTTFSVELPAASA